MNKTSRTSAFFCFSARSICSSMVYLFRVQIAFSCCCVVRKISVRWSCSALRPEAMRGHLSAQFRQTRGSILRDDRQRAKLELVVKTDARRRNGIAVATGLFPGSVDIVVGQ